MEALIAGLQAHSVTLGPSLSEDCFLSPFLIFFDTVGFKMRPDVRFRTHRRTRGSRFSLDTRSVRHVLSAT